MIQYRHDRARQGLPDARKVQHNAPYFADCLPESGVLMRLGSRGLAHAIEQLCAATYTAPSRFGRDAVRDPRLVSDLRAGRRIGDARRARVIRHFDALRVGKAVQHG